jgi:hypothetical protein
MRTRSVLGLALLGLLFIGAAAAHVAAPAAPLFQCNTQKHQIVIDGDPAAERLRYRVWNRPRSRLATPDLDIASGDEVVEGTGVCRYRYYRFQSGHAEYRVADGLGCTETMPPKDAVGQLTVLIDGEVMSNQWCRR